MPLLQARFYPNDSTLDTTSLVVVMGSDTVTNLTRRNRGMMEWEADSVRPAQLGRPQEVLGAHLPDQRQLHHESALSQAR